MCFCKLSSVKAVRGVFWPPLPQAPGDGCSEHPAHDVPPRRQQTACEAKWEQHGAERPVQDTHPPARTGRGPRLTDDSDTQTPGPGQRLLDRRCGPREPGHPGAACGTGAWGGEQGSPQISWAAPSHSPACCVPPPHPREHWKSSSSSSALQPEPRREGSKGRELRSLRLPQEKPLSSKTPSLSPQQQYRFSYHVEPIKLLSTP